MSKLVFVAHPWNRRCEWDIQKTLRQLDNIVARLWIGSTYVPLVPQKNASGLDGLLIDDRIKESHLDFLRVCDMLVLCGEWRKDPWCQEALRIATCESLDIHAFDQEQDMFQRIHG